MGVLVGMTGALIISGVIVVIVLAVLCASIFIVPQQQAYIIERFGKYNRSSSPASTPRSRSSTASRRRRTCESPS